jgi:tubulin--tyrosine ligase
VPQSVAAVSGTLTRDLPIREKGKPRVYALVDYDDDYVQPLIMAAMKSLLPTDSYTLVNPPSSWSKSSPEITLPDLIAEPNAKVLQIMPYESIDFDFASTHPDTCLVNSYVIRKALIRKHFLSATVDNWVAKHPDSVLKTHVKRSEAFEVDFAEFLDDALIEAFDLRESLDKNAAAAYGADGDDAQKVAEHDDESVQAAATVAEGKGEKEDTTEWWILKPSMSDRGQGIRLFNTMEQLQEIFDEWEPESSDEEDEDDENEDENEDHDDQQGGGDDNKEHIMTSHLRHFVAQPYIHPPLLLPQLNNRKFHIRVYVLCVGSLSVYVYRDMLALFAAKPYQPPGSGSSSSSSSTPDLDAHLTNTCLQPTTTTTTTPDGSSTAAADLVHRLDDLPLSPSQFTSLTTQICAITGDLFEAAARGMTVHFQPLPQAFEVYGLDFLADAQGTAWLLEVNAFPDFKQTGAGLAGVVAGFWEGVVRRAVLPFVVKPDGSAAAAGQEGAGGGGVADANGGGDGGQGGGDDGMVLVREVDLGRRW